MLRILIGNDFNEHLRDDRGWATWWVQRLAWFARDGDLLVLPVAPQQAFFDHVTSLTGTDLASLRFVVPPAGRHGDAALTADRLADPRFVADLRAAIGGRPVDTVFPLWPDAAVARLSRRLGITDALPGAGFMAQGGGTMLNSKVAFRAVAGGVGAPLPDGAVCAGPEDAAEVLTELLAATGLAMVKKEFLSGGRGNEILSRAERLRPVGARRVVATPDLASVRSYLADRWDWLSDGGRSSVVVEEYLRDVTSVFAEFHIGDKDVTFAGQGEMLFAPFGVAEIMPAPGLAPETVDVLVAASMPVCTAVQAMGYRGTLSMDAVVTPDQDVYFTEYNGRITGSTHIYEAVGRRVVGPDYAGERVLMDRVWPSDWTTPSFEDALARLTAAGLAYDPATREGVVLCGAYSEKENSVMHCVVAPTLDAAWERQARVAELFSGAPDHR